MRIHLEPAPIDGAGTATSTPTPTPAPQAIAPAPPPGILLRPGQTIVDQAAIDEERSELSKLRTERAERDRIEKETAEKELMDKGKTDEILRRRNEEIELHKKEIAQRDTRVAEIEARTKNYVTSAELNRAIAGRTDLADGAAAKLASLLFPELESRPVGDSWATMSRDNRTPADHLNAYLSLPENRLFLKSTAMPGPTLGGAGGVPASPSPQLNAFDQYDADFRNRISGIDQRGQAAKQAAPFRFGPKN